VDDARQSLLEVGQCIAAACQRAARDPAEVTLIGASKTVSAQRLGAFVDAGLRDLGENYMQEAIAKIDALGNAVRWHFIGALQSNKADLAVRHCHLIHSVDRISLAKAIDKAARVQDKLQEVLLQANVGDEATKAGCRLSELPDLAAACGEMSCLRVRGLMCLPPYHEDAEQTRLYFRELKNAREGLLRDGVVEAGAFVHLSMGMSHDFEVAIEEGATLVRIGTRLFGRRGLR
jgi:pyridoxal phosphate enzyme (YggS family)